MSKLDEAKQWLESEKCNATNVRRCRLTFKSGINNRGKHETMEACWYEQKQDGRTVQGFYILGGLPKCSYRKLGNKWHGTTRIVQSNRSCCFRIPLAPAEFADREFYTAGYFLESRDADHNNANQFGPNSLMFPWTHDDAIDRYERTTYERFDVDVEWID